MSEELVVDPVEETVTLWKRRKSVLGAHIKNARDRGIVLDYLEHLAMSLRTSEFLANNHLKWADLSALLIGKHYKMVKVAMKLGSMLKLKMAEDELQRRSIEGVEEPVYQGGELVGYKRKYSDTLLLGLLKSEDPDKYSDKQQVQLTGAVLKVNVTGVSRAPVTVDV